MDPINTIFKVLDWMQAKKKGRDTKIESYLCDIRKACEKLVLLEDPSTEEAKYLHEQIKVMYDSVSSRLSTLDSSSSWYLYRALSSARIYYWLRIYEQLGEKELSKLIEERLQLSPSMDALKRELNRASDGWGGPVVPGSVEIEKVKLACLSDIAFLAEVGS